MLFFNISFQVSIKNMLQPEVHIFMVISVCDRFLCDYHVLLNNLSSHVSRLEMRLLSLSENTAIFKLSTPV